MTNYNFVKQKGNWTIQKLVSTESSNTVTTKKDASEEFLASLDSYVSANHPSDLSADKIVQTRITVKENNVADITYIEQDKTRSFREINKTVKLLDVAFNISLINLF